MTLFAQGSLALDQSPVSRFVLLREMFGGPRQFFNTGGASRPSSRQLCKLPVEAFYFVDFEGPDCGGDSRTPATSAMRTRSDRLVACIFDITLAR